MTTVQLAIEDEYYASILRSLLSAERFNVLVVEKPDSSIRLHSTHFRFLARSGAPDYSILDDEGVIDLEENGLQGPFTLTDNGIDDAVRLKSPGVFALDDRGDGTAFRIVFVGRSDIDVNNQLHVYVSAYKRFKFIYSPSSRVAFETECLLFHDLDPYDNHYHPRRPTGSGWTCPRCKLLG